MDLATREFLILHVRVEEDLVLARHDLVSAHGRSGACVVFDVSALEPWPELDPAACLEEWLRTTTAHRQQLAILGSPGALGWDRSPVAHEVAFYPDLATCLKVEAPAVGGASAVEMTLPARVDYLPGLRQHLASVVKAQHGAAESFQVEILVDELALNAVENSPSSHNSYDLRFVLENHELLLEITNEFDEAVDSARIMNRRLQSFDDSGRYLGERGRGLFLIARIADGLQIRSLEGKRVRVTVTKRLRGQPPAAG